VPQAGGPRLNIDSVDPATVICGMEADEPQFDYNAEICDMMYFPNLGLVYGTTFEMKPVLDHPAIHFTKPALGSDSDGIYTVQGCIDLRPEVKSWLDEQGWPYRLSRTGNSYSSPNCRLILKFTEASHAVLFKLTWGG
jgi:hypothetical protein